jgi:hypothetical protein
MKIIRLAKIHIAGNPWAGCEALLVEQHSHTLCCKYGRPLVSTAWA